MNKLFVLDAIASLILVSCTRPESRSVASVESAFVRVDDMILDRENIKSKTSMDDEVSSEAASGYSVYGSRQWESSIIPVEFDAAVPGHLRSQFMAWAQDWSIGTGVWFVQRAGQAQHLLVTYRNDGCYSHVGAATGQQRNLNLAPACWVRGTVLHEMGHALGLMHEHQRPDRNSYISLQLGNVSPQNHFAFDLFSVMNTYEGYDFYSLMHYSSTAFSTNGQPSIVPLPQYAGYAGVMGQMVISASDRRVVSAMYANERGDNYAGFSESYYLAQYPDVANAVAAGWISSGRSHFAQWGCHEGRNPNVNFSENGYRARYPDVAAAVASGAFARCAFVHFSMFGRSEGRTGL